MVIAVNSHAGGNLSRTSCLYLFAFWPDIWSFHYKVVLLQVVLLQVVLTQFEVFFKSMVKLFTLSVQAHARIE